MKEKFRVGKWLVVAAILCVLGGAGWMYARTSDRVTLDVRNMEVRKVARMMERQTGQSIVVQSNVTGTVTLKAKNLPLEKALEIVGEQTSSRVGSIYPLYSSGKSLSALIAILTGNTTSPKGWTNAVGSGMRFAPGPGMGPRPEQGLAKASEDTISLNITFEELAFAALAFSRLTPARVVVEDSATNRVSITLKNTPVTQAVGTLAKKAGKKCAKLYVLSGRGPGRGPAMGDRAPMALTDEEAVQRETLNAELLATLPAEERERREKAEQERQKKMDDFKNMTAAERMQARTQMQPPGGGSQRMLERLKESTPEQRAAQRQQMAQARANGGGPRGGIFPPITRN